MLKKYCNKTIELALLDAINDLACLQDEVHYSVIENINKLFKKKVVIECYTNKMVYQYIDCYLSNIMKNLGLDCEVVTYLKGKEIYTNINTDNNSILIGKNGIILRAIQTITKQAVANTFHKSIEVVVDVNGYKQDRHKKVAGLAKKLGYQVLKTKTEIKLDPMPSDERKMMHKVLSRMDHIKTKSYGETNQRYLVISYSSKK